MIIDFRYHVASLIAVFLALGLGIVIGANLRASVTSQFEQQIEQLEQTYIKIREDQKILHASLQTKEEALETANQFQKAILPNLVTNRLIGKRIAIVRTNAKMNFKYAKQITALLRQAGADVTSVTTFNKYIDIANPDFKTELVDAFDLTMAEDTILIPQIYQEIIRILIRGNGSSQLLYLQNKEIVQLWGDYNRGPVDTLVFLGGSELPEQNYQKEIDLPLLEAARRNKITTIGVEPSFVTDSYMRLYQSKCLGSVDNVETSPGELSLVYLLASGKAGHYGIKDTARRLIPDLKLNY